MSCFVMNKEPLAALANAVEARLNCDYSYWGFGAPDSLYRELNDCKTSRTYFAEAIYKKLYALNIRAYNGRYSGHEEPAGEEAPIIDGSKYIVHRGQSTGSTALPLERGTTISQSSLTSGFTRPWRMRRATIPSGLLWWSFSVPFTPSL